MCGWKYDLVQLWAVSAERLTMVADTARRLPVWGQRVYVGQPWACMLWQQHSAHCAVQQDRDWSGQREPAWREAPLTRQHRYFLICPLKHFDIIRPHRATSTLIILTFGSAAKWARGRKKNLQKHWPDIRSWCMSEMLGWSFGGSRSSEDTTSRDLQLQQSQRSDNAELCKHRLTVTTKDSYLQFTLGF